MEEVVGFTPKQRAWFLLRDSNQCIFFLFLKGKWVRCKNTTGLEVHHIFPRGWCKNHFPSTFPVNGSYQGVSICRGHHCGYLADGDYRLVIHPDVEKARLLYSKDKNAFKYMAQNRKRLCERGEVYWNTAHDWQLHRWVQKHNVAFLRDHPYPENGNRGLNGRV